MKKTEKKVKGLVEAMAVRAAKVACGTASFNRFCQPKEPANLKAILEKHGA